MRPPSAPACKWGGSGRSETWVDGSGRVIRRGCWVDSDGCGSRDEGGSNRFDEALKRTLSVSGRLGRPDAPTIGAGSGIAAGRDLGQLLSKSSTKRSDFDTGCSITGSGGADA